MTTQRPKELSHDIAVAANNGQPQTPSRLNCAGKALASHRVSIAIDVVGVIPVGNLVSGVATELRAINNAHRAAVGLVGTGFNLLNPSFGGTVSSTTNLGLALANGLAGGTKAIPVAGNIVSGLTGLYDSYQAYRTYQQCMAGGG